MILFKLFNFKLVSIVLNFVTLSIISRLISEHDFDRYFLLLLCGGLASILIKPVLYPLSIGSVAKDETKFNLLLLFTYLNPIVSCLTSAIVCLIIFQELKLFLFGFTAIYAIFTTQVNIFQNVLILSNLTTKSQIPELIVRSGIFFIGIKLLNYFDYGNLEAVCLILLVSYFSSMMCAWYFCKRPKGSMAHNAYSTFLDFRTKYLFQFTLSGSASLITQLPQILVSTFFPSCLAEYNVAYKFIGFLLNLSGLVSVAFSGKIAAAARDQSFTRLRNALGISALYSLLICLVFSVGVWYLALKSIGLLFDGIDVVQTNELLLYMVFPHWILVILAPLSQYMYLRNQELLVIFLQVSSSVLFVVIFFYSLENLGLALFYSLTVQSLMTFGPMLCYMFWKK